MAAPDFSATGAAPSGTLVDTINSILQNSDKYTLATWFPTTFAGQSGNTYLTFGGVSEPNIRPSAAAAFGLAVSLATGSYNSTVTGISEASARVTCAKLVRSLAEKHRANTVGGWGRAWQSNLWAALAAQAGWLIYSDLTSGERILLANMIAYEADWRLSDRIVYWKNSAGTVLSPGDSKAEELSWNGMLLQAAVLMLPTHPHRGGWYNKMVRLMVAAHSKQSDLTSGEIVDGVNISNFLDGWNINSDGTIENHSRIHPDYMSTATHNLQASSLFGLAGLRPPKAAFHNADLIYSAMTSKNFTVPPYLSPGGTIYIPGSGDLYYPQANDWGTNRRMQAVAFDVFMDATGRSDTAASWAALHAAQVVTMQARSSTGQTYVAAGEDTYAGREQWVAMHAGWSRLAQWVAARNKYSA
jgi:hypothetical protein